MSTAATAQEKAPVGSFNPPTPSARLARRIWISFVAGLVAIAVLTAASGLAAFRYSSATGWVTNAHLALDHLYDLRVATARMAQRTELFVTTGDESYLAPREVDQRQALEALRSLSQSAGDSAASRRLLDDLASAAQARIDLDNGIVASRRLRGEDAAINGLRAERGRKIDQIFDDRIAQVETNERRLLDSHLAAERWLGRITIIVIILGCALALAAVGSSGSFISRALAMLHGSIAEEASARETLLRLNETLEERVAERSAAAEQRALELAHSQSALYRQTRLLQSLLVSMADAVIVCDKQMKLVEVNPAAERLLGREIRTLPIDQWPARFAFLAEEGGKPLGRADWPLARAARGEQIHARWLLSEAGKTSWLEGSAAPVRDDNGSILGTAMVFRDITDRQNAAEELSLARDLALESARLRSEFLTKMSHEIRAPLNGIIGMTQLLLDTELNDDQRDHLQTVWSSGNLLLSIVNDVLDFAKLAAGKVVLEQTPFDLYETVEVTVETFAQRAQSQNLDLILAISPDVPRDAYGDSRALTQILTNLVSNAIKFTETGEVVVEVGRVEVENSPGAIRFAIRDTGIGIATDARERLFDPFSQVDGSTSRKYGGSGLGLAITARLVEAMGGRINLASELGIGSTFCFTVGLITVPDSMPRTLEGAGLEGLSILLAEPNRTARAVITARLQAWGMLADSVATSPEAREALRTKLAANQAYDFILLDAALPPLDGNELATVLGLELAAAPTRILMMGPVSMTRNAEISAAENPVNHDRAEASPKIAGWIRKPVKPSVLCERLRALTPRTEPAPSLGSVDAIPPVSHRNGAPLEPQAVRVLVIEDNPVNLKLALLQLKKLGYQATGALSAREGLALLAAKNFPIVLMDIEMPEIDGYAATREIRADEAGPNHTIVIAMTAHALVGAREKCLEAGMDDFLTKPVTLETLRAVIERWEALIKHDSSDSRLLVNFEEHVSLDPSVLAEIRELSSSEDGDAVSELIALFLDDLPARLEKIAATIRANDLESSGAIAHSLQNACSSMGATRLGVMCEMAASSAREGNSSLLTTVLALARAEADHVRSLLKSEQQRPAA